MVKRCLLQANGFPVATFERNDAMVALALAFLIVAVVAGLFGFGIIASASAGIAQIIFFIFVVLFVLSLVFRGVGTPPVT
jgi:uncharacterized membrane protein YtjA (UPF0391 family)